MSICQEKVFWTLATAQFGELNLQNKDSLPWSFLNRSRFQSCLHTCTARVLVDGLCLDFPLSCI